MIVQQWNYSAILQITYFSYFTTKTAATDGQSHLHHALHILNYQPIKAAHSIVNKAKILGSTAVELYTLLQHMAKFRECNLVKQ